MPCSHITEVCFTAIMRQVFCGGWAFQSCQSYFYLFIFWVCSQTVHRIIYTYSSHLSSIFVLLCYKTLVVFSKSLLHQDCLELGSWLVPKKKKSWTKGFGLRSSSLWHEQWLLASKISLCLRAIWVGIWFDCLSATIGEYDMEKQMTKLWETIVFHVHSLERSSWHLLIENRPFYYAFDSTVITHKLISLIFKS